MLTAHRLLDAHEDEREQVRAEGPRTDPGLVASSTIRLLSSLRRRSRTAEGAIPTCRAISALLVRAFC